MGFHGIYPLVSSNMAGKCLGDGGFLARKIKNKWSIFQQAMFDYRLAIQQFATENGPFIMDLPMTIVKKSMAR